MRLTCPNCGAQYEVPDEVIPETGRDVQCSNCGDTWFQPHPDHMPDPEQDTADSAPTASDNLPDYDSEAETEPARPPETPQDDDFAEHAAEESVRDETEDAAGDAPEPSRRELDSSVRDILRQEAELEQQARAAETGGGLETQPDLGLDAQDEDRRTREARARMARLRGMQDTESEPSPTPEPSPDPADQQDIDPGSRSNLLPNIDDINSSLDAPSVRSGDMGVADAELADTAQQRGGFRRGFLWSVVVFVLLTLAYLYAPDIAGLSPALEGPMTSYVETVNALRTWLQETVASLIG